jgi:hypothetical protein
MESARERGPGRRRGGATTPAAGLILAAVVSCCGGRAPSGGIVEPSAPAFLVYTGDETIVVPVLPGVPVSIGHGQWVTSPAAPHLVVHHDLPVAPEAGDRRRRGR